MGRSGDWVPQDDEGVKTADEFLGRSVATAWCEAHGSFPSNIICPDCFPGGVVKLTHGRHCLCSSCAQQDWAEPGLAPCGMHGKSCSPVYAPIDAPLGSLVDATDRGQSDG